MYQQYTHSRRSFQPTELYFGNIYNTDVFCLPMDVQGCISSLTVQFAISFLFFFSFFFF